MKIHFIVHGKNKKALSKAEELRALDGHGHEFSFFFSAFAGHSRTLAQISSMSCEMIVAIGGDGTLHEVVNGMMETKNDLFVTLPILALIPCGSGNDFARNFSFTSDVREFIQKLSSPKTMSIDLFRVEKENFGADYMINVADVGFGPEVVERVETKPAHWSGDKKFNVSILQTFFTYRKKKFSIRMKEARWEGSALTIAIANGKYFGSGVGIAPDASVNDNWMNVTVIGEVSVLHYLAYLPKLKKAKFIKHPKVHYYRTKEIYIEGEGRIELDGELGRELPVNLRLEPEVIRFLV